MTFTASNGVTIAKTGLQALIVERDGTDRLLHINADRAEALYEFFRAERDEELGRWRWQANPSVVAWESRRSNEKDVTVLDESTGYVGYFTRADVDDVPTGAGLIRVAARAYFDAQPEPMPWHRAKPGEAWIINVGTEDFPNWQAVVVSNNDEFLYRDGGSARRDYAYIIAGRRIWPEDAS